MFIGCCWAIVAAAAVEALYTSLDPNEKIVQLSPQKLLDCCVPKPDPKKCDEMGYNYHFNKAFKWIVDHGISTEEDYPFQGEKGGCKPKDMIMYMYFEVFICLCVYVF